MNSKAFIWIGVTVGSTVGGLIPNLWGAGLFSFSGIILGAVGGIAGIWIGFKMANW